MPKDPSREAHFPSIEKKYGEPMKYWFSLMKEIADEKYPQQIAFLRENYGFSQAHANAVVMYSRGSTTTKKFDTPAAFYKTIDPIQAKTIKKIFAVIMDKYPDTELVIAWNQPMLKLGSTYIYGCSVAKKHILMAPWSKDVLEKFAPKMKDLDVKAKTIGVPNDWKVDEKLILGMAKARIAEIK